VVGKRAPDVGVDGTTAADEAALEAAGRFGVKPGSYVRARAFFALLVLADLHPKYLARAVNRHLANHAPATTRRAASAWSSFCRYLTGQQILAANPMDSPTVQIPARPNGDPTPLTYEEAQRLRPLPVALVSHSFQVRLPELCSCPMDGLRRRS
jgi:hypothetical protein